MPSGRPMSAPRAIAGFACHGILVLRSPATTCLTGRAGNAARPGRYWRRHRSRRPLRPCRTGRRRGGLVQRLSGPGTCRAWTTDVFRGMRWRVDRARHRAAAVAGQRKRGHGRGGCHLRAVPGTRCPRSLIAPAGAGSSRAGPWAGARAWTTAYSARHRRPAAGKRAPAGPRSGRRGRCPAGALR